MASDNGVRYHDDGDTAEFREEGTPLNLWVDTFNAHSVLVTIGNREDGSGQGIVVPIETLYEIAKHFRED